MRVQNNSVFGIGHFQDSSRLGFCLLQQMEHIQFSDVKEIQEWHKQALNQLGKMDKRKSKMPVLQIRLSNGATGVYYEEFSLSFIWY